MTAEPALTDLKPFKCLILVSDFRVLLRCVGVWRKSRLLLVCLYRPGVGGVAAVLVLNVFLYESVAVSL